MNLVELYHLIHGLLKTSSNGLISEAVFKQVSIDDPELFTCSNLNLLAKHLKLTRQELISKIIYQLKEYPDSFLYNNDFLNFKIDLASFLKIDLESLTKLVSSTNKKLLLANFTASGELEKIRAIILVNLFKKFRQHFSFKTDLIVARSESSFREEISKLSFGDSVLVLERSFSASQYRAVVKQYSEKLSFYSFKDDLILSEDSKISSPDLPLALKLNLISYQGSEALEISEGLYESNLNLPYFLEATIIRLERLIALDLKPAVDASQLPSSLLLSYAGLLTCFIASFSDPLEFAECLRKLRICLVEFNSWFNSPQTRHLLIETSENQKKLVSNLLAFRLTFVGFNKIFKNLDLNNA